VGILAPPNSVLLEVDGTWVQAPLNSTAGATEGFATCAMSSGNCPTYYFSSVDCTGPAYLGTMSSLVRDAMVVDGKLQYPGGPVLSRMFHSASFYGTDCSLYGVGIDSAEMKSVPLSTLGLVGPFHVSR